MTATCFGGDAGVRGDGNALGQDIRQQLVFQPHDLVLQGQLAALEAGDLQHVGLGAFLQGRDRVAEVLVFLAQVARRRSRAMSLSSEASSSFMDAPASVAR
jgi:hypothetical protein